MMNKLQKVQEALERVLIGGNHLATVLIKNVGADFADKCPPDMEHEDALRILCATDEYEIWCCWNAIMNAREALAELREFKEEGKSIEERLWQLLDDIDTAGDMFKPEVTEYFKYVVKKSEERHKYLISDGFTLRRRNGN